MVEQLDGRSVDAELAAIAARHPERLYARDGDRHVTFADLDGEVNRLADALRAADVGPGARVGISLANTPLHVALVFAVLRSGALWIPVNPKLKGAPLTHLLRDSSATHFVADDGSDVAMAVDRERQASHGVPLGDGTLLAADDTARLWRCDGSGKLPQPVPDTSVVMYTSGTTGPPKGVRVTERMLRAAALGAVEVADVRSTDVLYLWEPIFHIGGAQTLLVPLYAEASLALTRRFSASRFWSEVRRYGVSHIHYLGGILQILLQLPDDPHERDNQVRVAWGAGATPTIREACRQRFGFALHETYGMTETSSIITVNRGVTGAGIGRPLPWFDVRVNGETDRTDVSGETGEILVRGRVEGLLTPGYLGNDQATASSWDGNWFRTGDRGRFDANGHLHFEGRGSDSIRVRGENVSAWQVEDVFAQHPDVDRCAVVGIGSDVGEQDILLLLTPTDGRTVDPHAIVAWAGDHLAAFQLPRYVRVVDAMPLTPSQRIAKHDLPRDLDDATDCGRK